MKTISQQTGLITEREVEIDENRFLVSVCKFGQVWSYFVLDINGKVVENEPFKVVIDDIMRTWML